MLVSLKLIKINSCHLIFLELMKGIGGGIKEFKKATKEDVKDEEKEK
jgi:hypothetical protein